MKTKLFMIISVLLAITFFTPITFAQDESPWAESNEIHTLTIPGAQGDANKHTSSVHSVVFSPDGKTIASGSEDKTVRLWSLTPPPQLREDINKDGKVNVLDLVLVGSNFGASGENVADVNGDSVVNVLDLVLVGQAIGKTP